MRTVICHFYNEAYLLPWWLKHHLSLFDHGIMIDHGSTDASADLVRKIAPHWRLVRSRLTRFDAYLTDLEVMSYEQESPGWKIALNVTEFVMPTIPLSDIERELSHRGKVGCSASGMVIVDHQPDKPPITRISLPLQKHWGIDDNLEQNPKRRVALGQSPQPYRNRFYHRSEVGMYYPGRHKSFHPDSGSRMLDLMVFHFGYAPWNDELIRRKTQIASKLNPHDVERGWGLQHLKTAADLQADYKAILASAVDLNTHTHAGRAMAYVKACYPPEL